MHDVASISGISNDSRFGKVYFDLIGSVEIHHIILDDSTVQHPNSRVTVNLFIS